MNKANECTCPSGDGSLVHPCPAHPAVEQVGGDERAAFELFVRKHCGMPAHIAVNWDAKFTNDAWAGWQARAALAQPSDEVVVTKNESGAIVSVTRQDKEGRVLSVIAESQPSPAQAEAERPEVVARVVHSNPVVLGQCGPLNANDELMTVAQHAASVARWAEMFNRVEQERDAALAEVERLRESKGDPSGSFDRCMKMMYERDENAKRLDAALARVAELERQEPAGWLAYHFGGKRHGTVYGGPCGTKEEIERYIQQVERSDDSITLQGKPFYAAPVAQAQHSVPEASEQEKEQGWTLDYRFVERVTDLAASRTEYTTSMEATEQVLLAARELLAAAPGKEVGHE
ncbi:hypothetical protein ACVQEB_004607 [Pseudomonas aeruginosa]